MSKTIDEATELDLETAWLKRRRERGDKTLTRSGRTEVRHVCHYAKGALEELRTAVTRDDMTSRHSVLELKSIISDLEGLVAYLETGKGGFSALHDRS